MNMGQFAKLVMVTADNNNKYYEMTENGSGGFDVKYGRIQSTAQTAHYSMSQWQSKYREKVNKGYKDVTHTVTVEVAAEPTTTEDKTELAKVEDAKVQVFLELMQKYTKGLVSKTYTVKAQSVTQKQVDNAQDFIDKLMKIPENDVPSVNATLLELYMEIPRKMGNVRDYLLPNIDIKKTLQQEQDNLDAMASQVKMLKSAEKVTKKEVKKVKKETKTILDLLGIESIKEIKGSKEIDYLTKQITGKTLQAIFEVDKSSEKTRFDNWLASQTNKTTKLVYHGTKCTSVIPILEQGLKIRPTDNYQFSGKAYRNGNYFSEQFSTSIGYTDGYTRGSDAVMLIYEVHTGKESKSSFSDYRACKAAGYDSFEGGWLRVAYDENQTKIKYILWLK